MERFTRALPVRTMSSCTPPSSLCWAPAMGASKGSAAVMMPPVGCGAYCFYAAVAQPSSDGPRGELTRIVEVHDVLRRDGGAVALGGMKMPAWQHLQHLLLDAIADALQQLGRDHVALRVDGDFHDHIAMHSLW